MGYRVLTEATSSEDKVIKFKPQVNTIKTNLTTCEFTVIISNIYIYNLEHSHQSQQISLILEIWLKAHISISKNLTFNFESLQPTRHIARYY